VAEGLLHPLAVAPAVSVMSPPATLKNSSVSVPVPLSRKTSFSVLDVSVNR
jgi:hypothetical protein